MFEVKHICMVLGGALFGSAGIKLLSSKDAKKAYTHVTAAVMRCADSVMETATTFKENCGDIKADAKEINEKRYEEERLKEIEDATSFDHYFSPEESVDFGLADEIVNFDKLMEG